MERQREGGGLEGFLSLPGQSMYDRAVGEIALRRSKLVFTSGEIEVAFSAEIGEDGLRGTFSHSAFETDLHLVKQPEFQFQEEVRIPYGDHTLAGSLVLPGSDGPYPLILLVGTSASRNRDEYIDGFPVFRRLADHLLRRSIATFRWDDPGVGRSTGSAAAFGMASTTEIVGAVVDFLEARPQIDQRRIVLLGWEDGGLVAARTAADRPGIKLVLLVAFPAPGEAGLPEELRCPLLALYAGPDSSPLVQSNRDALERILIGINHPDYLIRVLPGADHLFLEKSANPGASGQALGNDFVEEFPDFIGRWLSLRLATR
jgi:pimeloyl-ACP methyl ester carboxylesterase